MRSAEHVVLALRAFGEAGEAAALAQRADAIAAARQNFVRIALVADVPDQSVVRRVEHIMQRHGELDHAKACAEMAAGLRHSVDGFLPQFLSELRQLCRIKLPQFRRSADSIEQRRFTLYGHECGPNCPATLTASKAQFT